jgi:hypothetical protein
MAQFFEWFYSSCPSPSGWRVGSLLLLSLLLSGCEVESKGDAGPLSLPPKEKVRVLARKIEDPANTFHWKWSVIGERNWTEAHVTDTPEVSVVLDKASPLSEPMKRKGCNIWEVDVTAKSAEGGIAWKARIHGSDGTTVEKEGIISGETNPREAVRVLQEKDIVAKLPAQLTLARIGERTVTFRIAR